MLGDLPLEVIHLIAQQLDNPALRACRYVNRRWNAICLNILFDTIVLNPRPGGLDAWHSIIADQTLRQLPTKAVILSFPIPDGKVSCSLDA